MKSSLLLVMIIPFVCYAREAAEDSKRTEDAGLKDNGRAMMRNLLVQKREKDDQEAAAYDDGDWSLNCPQTTYYGVISQSVTFECVVEGLNLYEDEIFADIDWMKEPEEYTVIEILKLQHEQSLKTKSHSSFQGRASLKPASASSADATDISLTLSNLQAGDFGDYKVEVIWARGSNFQGIKSVYVTLKEEYPTKVSGQVGEFELSTIKRIFDEYSKPMDRVQQVWEAYRAAEKDVKVVLVGTPNTVGMMHNTGYSAISYNGWITQIFW